MVALSFVRSMSVPSAPFKSTDASLLSSTTRLAAVISTVSCEAPVCELYAFWLSAACCPDSRTSFTPLA